MNKPVILCIDDEAVVLNSLKVQLKSSFGRKFKIECFESGEKAFSKVNYLTEKGIHIPVVIADHIMPGMKGDELLSKIYKTSPNTRNIMLTGLADARSVGNAVNYSNLFRYIEKPWDNEDLVLTIEQAIRSYYFELEVNEQRIKLDLLVLKLENYNERLKNEVKTRTEELDNANKTKDKLFSIIAHDLASPFNSIIGFSDLLVENDENLSVEDRKVFIKTIRDSSQKVYNLLQNLFTWARSQSKKLYNEPKILNLKNIVNATIEMNSESALKKGIKLNNNISDVVVIFADENMTNTILRNLLSNAIKFTPRNGKVTLSAKKRFDDNFLEISVKDNGVGMPEEQLNGLFKSVTNESTFGTENEKGTGLGLILCKELTEMQGGEFVVESQFNIGSNFIFTLPINDRVTK